MNDRVLFQMWSGFRDQLIEKHEFYVSQAKSRLLGQFTDAEISDEADRTAEESWERRGQNFNPDFDDPDDGAEDAYQDGVWRHQLLTELRDSVRMNIVAGFFHEWEKSLRQWLVDEVRHWHHGEYTKDAIWKANVDQIFDLLESFGWQFKAAPWFSSLDACRLVVNVHKHGDGPSLKKLDAAYPRFLVHPFADILKTDSLFLEQMSHEHMQVVDADLDDFADSITQFWREVPENVFNSQIENPPSWLMKAIEKDGNSAGGN